MIRMRAMALIDSAFDPLPRAKFSMRTMTAFDRQTPRKCSRGRLDRLANIVDQSFDQLRVLAFGHHPDQRLGAGLADHQPALPLQLGFGGRDSLADIVHLERLAAAVEADVLEQ